MEHTAVITQPTYMPWLGYFEQIARADTFVFLDSAQFVRRNWDSRNRLKGPDGSPFWLTVPVAAHKRDTRIRDMRISQSQTQWRRKHLNSIRTALGGAAYFDEVFPDIESWLAGEHKFLADLNIAGIRMVCRLLELEPVFLRSSDLDVEGRKSELLVALCAAVGASHYYSSIGSKDYMDADLRLFEDAGIAVEYQAWPHPEYLQQGKEFVSHLSVIDVLCNIGPKAARKLIIPPPD